MNSADSCSDMFINDDENDNYIFSEVNLYNNNFDKSEGGFCIPHYFPIDISNLDKQDPLFVDEMAGFFHLQEFSPCIDTGTDGINSPDNDIDGVSRPIGADYDMGAYESIHSCEKNHVKLNNDYFSDISECYQSVSENGEILCHALTITDDVDFNEDFLISLKGGYTCDYSGNNIPGYMTQLNGSIIISGGTVIVENFAIQ